MTRRLTVAGVELTKIDDGWSAPNSRFGFIHQTDPDNPVGWQVWDFDDWQGLLPDNEWGGVFPTLEYAVEMAKENLELGVQG